jgi:hypothetical protein
MYVCLCAQLGVHVLGERGSMLTWLCLMAEDPLDVDFPPLILMCGFVLAASCLTAHVDGNFKMHVIAREATRGANKGACYSTQHPAPSNQRVILSNDEVAAELAASATAGAPAKGADCSDFRAGRVRSPDA